MDMFDVEKHVIAGAAVSKLVRTGEHYGGDLKVLNFKNHIHITPDYAIVHVYNWEMRTWHPIRVYKRDL